MATITRRLAGLGEQHDPVPALQTVPESGDVGADVGGGDGFFWCGTTLRSLRSRLVAFVVELWAAVVHGPCQGSFYDPASGEYVEFVAADAGDDFGGEVMVAVVTHECRLETGVAPQFA